jgi:transposase
MFIKSVPKTDRSTGKTYVYFRLCESYRFGSSIRHRNILSLGTLDELTEPHHFKLLADRIEQLIKGLPGIFDCGNQTVERLAQTFYKEIVDKKLMDRAVAEKTSSDYQQVDVNSIEFENVRETGSEWMCLQALRQLNMEECLEQCGFEMDEVPLAMAHLISRAVFPESEYATAQWMKDNSSVCELLGIQAQDVSYHHLYEISKQFYRHKTRIESWLSKKTSGLFDLQDKIILYDLTNTYFEGRKQESQMAMFGVSKEKRSDARLITLALVVNVEGFVKYSQIYRGNIADPATLESTVKNLALHAGAGTKPLIVIDAGISSQDNLDWLRGKGYDYLCVSRSRVKNFKTAKEEGKPVVMTDKRGSPIEMLLVSEEGSDDTLLYVRSERKARKELSMHEHFTTHFEEGLSQIQFGVQRKGGTKKTDKVWERIGRLKQKYPSAHRYYKIEVESDNEIVTNLTWKKIIPVTRKQEGIYFLRTSLKEIDEKTFWLIYNTIREIEASFRVLKADLRMRPVFHQSDYSMMAHLNLAVIAYQLVNTIRYQLKAKGIHHNWSNLVRIMNSQKAVTATMLDKQGRKILIRKCSKPEAQVKEIYDALGYKYYPFLRKSVLPENEHQKNESPFIQEINDS